MSRTRARVYDYDDVIERSGTRTMDHDAVFPAALSGALGTLAASPFVQGSGLLAREALAPARPCLRRRRCCHRRVRRLGCARGRADKLLVAACSRHLGVRVLQQERIVRQTRRGWRAGRLLQVLWLSIVCAGCGEGGARRGMIGHLPLCGLMRRTCGDYRRPST